MKDTPNVSVIVPVFNGADTVHACIESLLTLDYDEGARELIFVDNASTDETAEILRSHGQKICAVFESTRGPAAARNRGLRAARYEIVAMTDADCTVDRHWLRELVQPLRDPSVGLVGGTISSKQPCNAIETFGERIHDHRMAIEVWQPPYVITMNWASRKSLVERLGFFNEKFLRNEDADFSYRAYQAGVKFIFAPGAIVRHQNEKTYPSLFREGYLHGFYAVQTLKTHRRLLAQMGQRRIYLATYRALLSNLKQSLRGQQRSEARCHVVFNAAKKLGMLTGSFRFADLNL